ncbi:MAG: hypothetical protein M1830_003474 [Pleopsidium flavum]|nr:MAG: hypothetical protein M1830_003474 [Pleopsidium flavum]
MAILNVLTDFIILALPIPFLWELKASPTRKVQLFGIFGLGGCVCVFGIIRATYVGTASPKDPSWNDVNGAVWSIIEVCVAVVSACLPTMRPLFSKSVPNNRTAPSKGASDYNGFSLPLSNKPKQGWTNMSTDTIEAHDDKRPFARLGETSDVEGGRQPTNSSSRPNNLHINVRTDLHQQYHTQDR